MSTNIVAAVNDLHAARWREWQAGNALSSRKSAVRARIVFAVLFAALAVGLGVTLGA